MQSLNNYNQLEGIKFIRKIGKGGNATVYLVEKDDQQFALKVFQFEPSEKDYKMQRLQNEFDLVKGLQIESIPKLYDMGECILEANG